MEQYLNTTYACSRVITHAYSTSFTLGIRTLDKQFHDPVYAIYGFVRLADEIVDTFHDYDKAALIRDFEKDTWEALEQGISLNPILNAFQDVVNAYSIEHELIRAFLESMKMDLDHSVFDEEKFEKYVYGSAEVVGLMCLRVFCNGREDLYQKLESPARKLGAAFQKVNFLRDIKNDYEERGRIYFPQMGKSKLTKDVKSQIEQEIASDFQDALAGIRGLPRGARFGVYVAYVYYRSLFKKISRKMPQSLMKERIRVPNGKKALLLMKSYFEERLNLV